VRLNRDTPDCPGTARTGVGPLFHLIVPNERGSMSTHLLLAGTGNVVSGLGVACLNVIVALALVAVSLLLVLAVSSVAWLLRSPDRDSANPRSRRAEGASVTPALLIARGLIIHWVTLWLAPVEHAFDMIESELERRGVDLQKPRYSRPVSRCAQLSPACDRADRTK
jgi:hypothetical protein